MKTNEVVNKKEKKKIVKKDRLGIYFLIGAVLGAILFILLYGVRVLDFTNDSWLLTGQDLQQHYAGWMFFRNAQWQFPIGMHDGVTNPYSISILYTDSIPLFAILFKALSPMLPETFQYFGLFGIMCYILNGGFAAVIIAKFTKNKWIVAAASTFFIFSMPVLQRLFGLTAEHTRHTSLAAHFLILASMAIWLHREHFQKYWKAALAFSLLGIGCVLIQMYLIFMVGGIMCGYLLHCLLKEKDVKRIFIVLGSFFASSMIVFYVVGGFSSGVSAGMGGFGEFSANINSLVNSFNYSSFLPKFAMKKPQYEGVSYLGLGIIVMFSIFVVGLIIKMSDWKKKKILKEKIKFFFCAKKEFYIPLFIVLFVFAVLAISSEVYLGNHFIIGVKFNTKIEEILGVFRSSGRFMWIIMYSIMIVSLAFVLKKFKKKTAYGIIIGCMILQLIDFGGAFRRINNEFSNEVKQTKVEKDLPNPFWKNIPDHYDKVLFFPMSFFTQETVEQYLNIGVVAAKNNLTMNYFYLSRPYGELVVKGNGKREKEFKKGIVDDKALYIMDIYKAHDFASELNLYMVDQYIVGSREPISGLTPYADMILSKENRSYHLDFVKGEKLEPTMNNGWYSPGKDYTWASEKGTLTLITERIQNVHVRMEYVQNPDAGESKLYLNGTRVATIPENGPGYVEFDMDLKELRGKLSKETQMHILNVVTKEPAKITDKKGKKKKQGIAIRSMQIDVTDFDKTKK